MLRCNSSGMFFFSKIVKTIHINNKSSLDLKGFADIRSAFAALIFLSRNTADRTSFFYQSLFVDYFLDRNLQSPIISVYISEYFTYQLLNVYIKLSDNFSYHTIEFFFTFGFRTSFPLSGTGGVATRREGLA